MDFFEAQARAKKRTSRLVVMFVLAVIGTIIGMYLAVVLVLGASHQGHRYRNGYDVSAYSDTADSFWNAELFVGVSLATVAVVGLGSLYKWSQFSAGGSAVAESVGGRRVDPNTRDLPERRLLNVVEEMAIASGVAVPAVYILDEEPAINAFAAGLTNNDAVVAVSRGALERLTRDELQGVIGHEFSHILNGDTRLNLRIASLIFGILVLGLIGRGVLWSLRGTRIRGKNGGGMVAAILAIGLALVIIGYVGYFFGRLIQAAVSRQREFLADASSVQFTRNPAGITGALKKIGGFELGSTMQHNQSAAIGHFFFSQAFLTGITGLWATHPPLEERIRAIDPNFDGQFIEPPVEIADEAEVAGLRSGLAGTVSPDESATNTGGAIHSRGRVNVGAASSVPPPLPASSAVAAVATIGTLTPEQIANAQLILDTTPARLRTATQSALEARALLCGLLLDHDPAIRARQRRMVATHAGAEVARMLDELDPALREVRDAQRLPLVQLAIPALRQVPPPELQPFLAALDELIRADNQISAFEFALQRLLTHALALGRKPGAAVVQYYSFNAVVDEIAIVLSVLARASTSDDAAAPAAFAAGAAQIKLIESRLHYSDQRARDLAAFDAALDKLAAASLPIKQRTLMAAAHVVQADGQVLVCEFELLRAVSAALDIPMPPLLAAA